MRRTGDGGRSAGVQVAAAALLTGVVVAQSGGAAFTSADGTALVRVAQAVLPAIPGWVPGS
ncbi:hypothetical protein [Kitasatospora sp. NPDC088346]|uniref:hypothetical protein n=1 Tax=Kitasatospora sp. NPDC088346 TaxID=3364073 RepID=UPI003823A484